jgi:antitoxin (DNA-binding transcriptional repressor) of toxin-antitoxin stability system
MCAACATSANTPPPQPVARLVPATPFECRKREKLPVINEGDDARSQIARHRSKLVIQNKRSVECEKWIDDVREDIAHPEK